VSRFQGTRTTSSVIHRGQQYLLAVAAVALCLAASLIFNSLAHVVSFLLFLPAVLFSLWMGGFRVAIFSTVLSAVVVDLFLIHPYFDFKLSFYDLTREVLFVCVTVAAAWLFERYRRRTEGLIQVQHDLLETAVESILVTDSQHHIVSWYRGAEKLYGWSEAESLGKMPEELLKTTYPKPQEEIEREIQETGRWRGKLVRKCRNGRTVVTESSWVLDRGTGLILQADVDITEADRAETELKRMNRALRTLSRVNHVLIHSDSAEILLQQAIEAIEQEGGYPLAWIGFPNDDDGHSVRIGPASGKLAELLNGLKLTWSDEPDGRGPCGMALRTGKTCVVHRFLDDPNCAPWHDLAASANLRSAISFPLTVQGKVCAALTLYASEENAFEGQELGLVSELAGDLEFGLNSLHDRKQADEERAARMLVEEQLRQAQKMEAIGRLAGGISHDFNNLLMVIMAQTELLSLQVTGSALARAESVMKSAQRAADLTRQLLAFSRKQVVQPTVLSLNPILLETAKMASHLVGEDIEITTSLCEDPWHVNVDRSQIEQVIMNLVVNARDAMPSGGRLTLETANVNLAMDYIAVHPLVPPGRYVLLAVSDTGIGMTDDVKNRLFEPFFTTKEPGKGTGLGLPMVYGIVKQSRGFVWVYTEPGKGSCFKVYLPAADTRESEREPTEAAQSAPSKKHATILLVEDEHSLREVVTEFLRTDGYRVIPAESYDEAMERASQHGKAVDLLLTDVVLRGGQNGKQLSDALLARGYRIKIIYMSGYTPNAIVHRGILEEGTLFLQKPFTRAMLLAKVREALVV
jgi:PAS domain S-box-containing protein